MIHRIRLVAFTLVCLSQSPIAQEMRPSEEPAELGYILIRDKSNSLPEGSHPYDSSQFTRENGYITATGLRANTPYQYVLSFRTNAPVMGRVSSETDAVYYGKHSPLQMPNTAGEWKRASFFFRTAPGAKSISIRFSRPRDGGTIEMKEPRLMLADTSDFTAAWQAWREQYPDRDLTSRPGDGQNLLRFIGKLQDPPPGLDQLLVYGIGSSYTNMLGNGERLIQWVQEHFPNAPEIVYKKHVGSAVAYDFTRGWMRQLVLGEKPDLVILYSEGQGADLDKLLQDFRSHSDADLIVASLHLRERAGENTPETVFNDQWKSVRAVAEKYQCEWVDNRAEHAAYLEEHGQPIEWLLKDAVHQSDHGALVINENIVRHLTPQTAPAIELVESLPVTTEAIRVDLYGKRSPSGGQARILINGEPADQFPAFVTTVIVPGPKNHRPERGSPADRSPHMITLGRPESIVPQTWTIRMTSDKGDFELIGSVTGPDGGGNNGEDVTGDSGQITVPTELWRRRLETDGTHSNKKGDLFTWEVKRATLGTVDFAGENDQSFRVTLVDQLPEGPHRIEVIPRLKGASEIIGYELIYPAWDKSEKETE